MKEKTNLIVTGSSQANRALDLYDLLKDKFDINVILTKSAYTFVDFYKDIEINTNIFDFDFYAPGVEKNMFHFNKLPC